MAVETKSGPWLREATKDPLQSVATVLHNRTPLTANHITLIGTAGVLGCSALVERINRQQYSTKSSRVLKGVAEVVRLGFEACDGLDGAKARIEKAEIEAAGEIVSERAKLIGENVDRVADRIQESGTALQRARTARHRGDVLGEGAAYATAILSWAPSAAEFHAAGKGVGYREQQDAIEIVGARPGKAVLGHAAGIFPRAQPLFDTIAAAASINTARIRLSDGEAPEITSDKARNAKLKRGLMLAGAAITGVAVVYRLGSDR